MKINDTLPVPAVEFEPSLTLEQRAAAAEAIREQRDRRNEIDRVSGRHPACSRNAALAGEVDP